MVVDLAAEGIPLSRTCRVLGFSKQAFYAWRADPISQRDCDDAHLANAAIDVHADDPAFGFRLIHDELTLTQGRVVGRNRVARLCREQRVFSVMVMRRGRIKVVGPVVHDDHGQRKFKTPRLEQAWFTDITEHPTEEGKLYVCVIKDACPNPIVGLSMGPRITSDLACNALRYAITTRSPVRTIVHSDRGGQFRSRAFATTLRAAGLPGSMRRGASAADNATMEALFALLQENLLNRRRLDTREKLRLAILTWMERCYHRRHQQAALGRLTPIEIETIDHVATAANRESQRNSSQSHVASLHQVRSSGSTARIVAEKRTLAEARES